MVHKGGEKLASLSSFLASSMEFFCEEICETFQICHKTKTVEQQVNENRDFVTGDHDRDHISRHRLAFGKSGEREGGCLYCF